ncbi:MAG: DUF1559 domain-containing protein [Pirellulales bacterium]|nr:DUF1559 domain-containing protein [Pirellulales bacterium]
MLRFRSGLSALEWMVLIVVVGILLGILLSSLPETHITVRNVRCSVNVKNLALATIQYENTKGNCPGYVMDYGTWTAGDAPEDPTDPDADTTTLVSHRKIGSWAVALFPWLDHQALYEHWTDQRYPIAFGGSERFPLSSGASGEGFSYFATIASPIFICPSSPLTSSTHGPNSYICNAGMYHRGPGGESSWQIRRNDGTEVTIDFLRSQSLANGVFNNQFSGIGAEGNPVPLGPKVTWDDLTDGKTNTVIFSENLQAIPWHRAGLIDAKDLTLPQNGEIRYEETCRFTQGFVWHYEDADLANGASAVKPVHCINGGLPNRDRFNLQMNSDNAADLARPSSTHPDGVNAGFADGANRFLSDTIDYRVYQALMTPQGHQSDSPVVSSLEEISEQLQY